MTGGLDQQLGLGAALFSGDQHLGDGRGFGKGQFAVLLVHEVAAQGNEEENAQAAAGQADEDGLHRMRIEVEDVERRNREDGAGDHAAGGAAHAGDDHVLQHGGAAAVHARQPDGEDGDGNRRLHSLADLQGGVGRSHAEDDAQQRAPEHRAPGDFRQAHAGGHQRHIELTLFQRLIGIRGQGLGLELRCSGGHEYNLRAVWQPKELYPAGSSEDVMSVVSVSDPRFAAKVGREDGTPGHPSLDRSRHASTAS